MKFVETILKQMRGVCKSQQKFVLKALEGFLSVTGRLTFTNLSRYMGLCEKTFRRQFAKPFDFALLNLGIINQFFGDRSCDKFAIAFDPFFMSKAGNKTYGKGTFWSGSAGSVEKGIEASLLCVVNVTTHEALALDAIQTPNSDEFKKMRETQGDITRIDWFADYILSRRHTFPKGIKRFLVDAYFFKEKFITKLCEAGYDVIGKMRIDARLLLPYDGPQKARGRRKKYGGEVDWNMIESIATDDPTVTLKSAVVWCLALNRLIRAVLVCKTCSNGRVMQALLFSTDTTMLPMDIYLHYAARFHIEFVIRDAKQHAGLEHCQSTSKDRLRYHINMSFLAVNVARINEYQRAAGQSKTTTCSVASQRVKHHNEMLIRSFFSILGLDIVPIKSNPLYEQALAFGTIT